MGSLHQETIYTPIRSSDILTARWYSGCHSAKFTQTFQCFAEYFTHKANPFQSAVTAKIGFPPGLTAFLSTASHLGCVFAYGDIF